MAQKRPRSEFERPPPASFAVYGRALPALDAATRDDGSYVPVWKQEVVDDRGRKRLHGAFTGGFSAGYFNTVGSKEGWTPATFKSSRGARATKAGAAKPEDFMDEEDLREAEEARQLETSESFAGIGGVGGTEDVVGQRRSLMDLLVPAMQDTMGTKLLKKMGWKEGQGIGPKTLRRARDFDGDLAATAAKEDKAFLFAPENSRLIAFKRKDNSQGLGYAKEESIAKKEEKDEEIAFGTASRPSTSKPKKASGAAFGVGVLNDDGEDEEDIYEIRPKWTYNKVIGGDKPKKKNPVARPSVGKHVFVPKKGTTLKSYQTARKCHDGRLPIPGFILSDASVQLAEPRYPPPVVPDGWKGTPEEASAPTAASTTADKAAASLNPRARGALLGEAPLPGKSVFDFLTPDARNRIANLTGKTNLPQGLGEAPVSAARPSIADIVPPLDSEAAIMALNGGYMPYGDDPDKQARYRSFLEVKAGLKEGLPDRKYGMNTQDWAKEMGEFVGAARIFKPLTGSMATRFTTSTFASNIQGNMDRGLDSDVLLHRPAAKEEDPAEAAAKLGIYGPLTRSIIEFAPNRLLCKRFNVQFLGTTTAPTDQAKSAAPGYSAGGSSAGIAPPVYETVKPPAVLQVDADKNEALEAEKASEEVFKKIFGDWDEDDDEDD
ncbi:hypothetical protein BZA05DRAFT_215265 [Tricharina praecox]|uniref:uncharacterized protein n=1 Tax=Tricharina praecox TaxID=43433 RepID=UPI00221F8384|nr:uncharacterized protein BZA05DRAFT_215265 [Tricharina praecox]KAI5855675.1 hypothetical protein BZA05DRAFT_215265 [Tricharina praecox]